MTKIILDKNFAKKCDDLMKDLPKPITQEEDSVIGDKTNFWKDIYDCLSELLQLRQQQEFEMYQFLLKRVDALMDADSDEEQELEILSKLVEEYENRHYPIEIKE